MKRVILLLVNALLISSVVCFAQDPQYYTVYWSVNGDVISNQSVEAGSFIDMTPEAPMPSDCIGYGYTFIGWTESPISGSQGWEPSPLYTNVSDFPSVTQDITYYAVFRSDATAGGGTYEMTDVLTCEMTGVASGSTTYVEWTGIMASSSAMYAGNTAGGNNAIQMRSSGNNSGIITTATGGTVTMVSVDWSDKTSDGQTLNVYGSSTPFTSVSELYSGFGTLVGTIVKGSSTELSVTGYEYIGVRSNNGALYLNSISIIWNTPGAGGTMEYVTSCSSTPAGGDATSGTLTSGQSWSLDDGRLSITGGGNIAGFEDPEGVPWYNRRNEITYLFLGADFFSIGAYVFYDLENLTSISCPSSYMPTIVANTFNPNKISQITATVRANLLSQYQADPYWSQMTLDTYPDSGGDKPTIIAEGYFGDGDALHWALYSDGQMNIDGEGYIPNYTIDTTPWGSYVSDITSVQMSGVVSSIGQYAFYGCTNLTYVYIPYSVSVISDYAFANCSALTQITSDAANAPTVRSTTFNNISVSYINLSVPCGSTESYQAAVIWQDMNISSQACGNSGNEPVTITAEGDFGYNDALHWAVYSDGKMIIEGTGESIPEYTTGANDQPWYDYRETITELIINSNSSIIGNNAFAGLYKLQSVTFPEDMYLLGDYSFSGCSELSSITVRGTINVMSATTETFDGISDLTAINLYVPASMYSQYRASEFWSRMRVMPTDASGTVNVNTSWTLHNGVLSFSGDAMESIPYFSSMDGQPWGEYRESILTVDMSGAPLMNDIGGYAFAGCTALTQVIMPQSLTYVGGYAFLYCNSLSRIDMLTLEQVGVAEDAFDGLQTESIKLVVADSMVAVYQSASVWGNMNVTPLSEVSSGGDDQPQVIDRGYLGDGDALVWRLYDNGQLTFDGEGAIPDFPDISYQPWSEYRSQITEVIMNADIPSVGNYAFSACDNLTTVTLSSSTTQLGDYTFSECDALTLIIIPAEEVISASELVFGSYIDREQLKIAVPASQVEAYQGAMFWYEYNIIAIGEGSGGNQEPVDENILASGSFSGGQEWEVYKNGELRIFGGGDMPGFDDPTSVPWYDYRDTITSLLLLADYWTIGQNLFYSLDSLTTVSCYSSRLPTLQEHTFNPTNLTKITLRVSSEMVSQYQEAEYWSQMNVQSYNGGSSGNAVNGKIGDVNWEVKEGMLRLYGEGEIDFSSADDQPWAAYRNQIYKLNVSGEITLLGTFAVGECSNLNEVIIQTESLDSIGISAFAYCTGLVQISILSEIVIRAHANAFAGVTTSNITLHLMEEIMESYQDGVWADMQKVALNTGGDEIVDGLVEGNMRWAFNTSTGLLSIYGYGAMPEWIGSMAPWGDYVGEIHEVEVCYGITYVCNYAFANNLDITKVTLAASVDSIGENIFTGNNSPIQFYLQSMTPPGITENTFANVQGCVYAYCYESAFSAYDAHRLWSGEGGVCLGYDDDPQDPGLLSYQPQMIYINNVPIADFNPNLYNYDITVPEGSGVPLITYLPGNSSQDITVEQPNSLNDAGYVHIDNMATYSIYFTTDGADPQGETVVIALNSSWRFIMLPSSIDPSVSASDIVIDGEVEWAKYNGYRRAAGQSGWETEEFESSYNQERGHIVRAVNDTATIIIHLPADYNQQSASLNLALYNSTHEQNANWNLLGNPYSAGYSIAGLEAVGIESPITVWNGTGYTTYTPGIDQYVLQPFEAFFIQHSEDGPARLNLSPQYVVNSIDGGH